MRRLGLTLLAGLLGYALFFTVQTLRPRTLALELPAGTQPGDVVLMRSHTWRAEIVRLIDGVPYRDGFSHVGLAHTFDDGEWMVVHAVPGRTGTVREEGWPSVARGGGISEAVVFRAELSPEQRAQLTRLQSDAAARAVPFDSGFDHHDDGELYCTELVTALYAQVGHAVVDAGVMDKRAIFPGHLAGSTSLARVGTTAAAPR